MPDVMEEIRGFQWGVQAAAENDETPLESTPYAWNTALRSIGGGLATLGVRPGLKVVNTTALTSSPSFFLMKNYPYNNSGITNKFALVTAIGRLYFKDGTNTIGSEIVPPANFPYTSGHCFANGDYAVDAAVMNNRLFMVNTNGERRSVLNETFKMFGMSTLSSVAITAEGLAAGTSAMPAETYNVAVTTYDSTTGAESSSSADVSVTLAANDRVKIVITPSAAETAQNSHWRVYLQRTTTQSQKFRVLTLENVGGASVVTDGNIPIATTTVYVDLSATQISQLVLAAPSTVENGVPPSTARYIATYGGRLILADLQNFYWSKLGLPDAFPPQNQENIDSGEGDEIKGVHEFSDDLLLIFTANNVWGVFGNDPQSWTIKAVDHNTGCATHRSIVEVPGGVMWWSATQGPVLFDGNEVKKVGLDKLGQEICIADVEGSRMNYVAAGFDPIGQRSVFSYSLLAASTRNNAMLPYSTRVGQFEATRWNPMDISCMGMGYDTDNKMKMFMGNYAGQIFVLDGDTMNDGAPSGTVTGTFTPVSATPTTITNTGFYTTGSGLTERYVIVKDSTGRIVGRERISSNTSTVLTLANALALTSGVTYTFDVAGCDFRVYTKWMDFKQAFLRKRIDNVYVHIRTDNDSENLLMSTLINYVNSLGDFRGGWGSAGTTYDAADALFDTSVWGGLGAVKKRFRVIRNCNAIQVAIFHSTPNKDIILLKIGAMGRSLSDRYYG